MFVIGRNVEVRVTGRHLIIECWIKDVVSSEDQFGQRTILATTLRDVRIPKTDLFLNLILTRKKTK